MARRCYSLLGSFFAEEGYAVEELVDIIRDLLEDHEGVEVEFIKVELADETEAH